MAPLGVCFSQGPSVGALLFATARTSILCVRVLPEMRRKRMLALILVMVVCVSVVIQCLFAPDLTETVHTGGLAYEYGCPHNWGALML